MLKKEEIRNIRIWEIIMSIFIIGLINIYIIHIYGIEGIYPIIEIHNGKEIWENMNCGGILKINEKNLLYIIVINIFLLIIFNSGYKYTEKNKILLSTEYIYLLSFGIIGLNIIILSNDLIYLFISLELYSISIYILILLKITKNTSRMSIIYLLINSLSSYIFLLGISLIYKNTGSVILEEIFYIINNNEIIKNKGEIGLILIIISLLIKLGSVPFNFWVLRLYTSLENRILLYQIIIPKLVYIYILNDIYINLIPGRDEPNMKYILIVLNIIAILSVIIGSIGGLFNTYYKSILTYSSILNIGFILIGIFNNINNNESKYSLIEYLLIYSINTLALFFCFLIIKTKNLTGSGNIFNKIKNNQSNKFQFNKTYPFYTICILIIIFSLIGIPPFAGFFAKLNIFINLINSYNEIWMIPIIFLLIGTFISACFYIKFLLYFFFRTNYNLSNINNLLISDKPIAISYYYTFLTIFLIIYPFISNYLYPFYILFI